MLDFYYSKLFLSLEGQERNPPSFDVPTHYNRLAEEGARYSYLHLRMYHICADVNTTNSYFVL
jgi:hypothetical protein